MSAQEQYERYAHISRQLSLNSDVTDDPIAADRRSLWNSTASRNAKQQSQCVISRLAGNKFAGDDNLSQEVDLNAFDDDKEEEVFGYTHLHRLCILPQNGPSDPRWDDVRQHLSQLSNKDMALLTSTQKGGNTPLHVICFLSPPVDLVQHIIQLCPDSASMTTDHGETALGLACNGFVPACEVVIQALVKAFPSARNHVNSFNETPLHIHLSMSRNYHVDPSPSVVRLLTTVDAVNTKDRKGCTPLCILGKAASESMSLFASCIQFFSTPTSHESPNIDNYKKSLQILLDYDPSQASKSQFLRDLLHFPKSLLVVSFEKEHTRRVLNDICGRGPYVALLMADFYIQLMIIISFTIGCNFGFKGNGSTTSMLIGSAYWIFRRFASAMGSSSIIESLMYEPWRLLNLLQAFVLMSASIYLRNNGIDLLNEEGVNGTWRNILILTSGLIWFNLLGIVCHIMKGFSVFVYATTQIFKQLINLFLVFIVIFLSFSTMLYMSSVDSPGYCTPEGDAPGEYCTLNEAMNKIGFIFFGALEAEDFDVPQPTLVLFIFYNVIVIILLLNIIIAVMSDSYTEVNQGAELIFWNHRFDLIHDVDAFVNCFTHFIYCQNRKKKKKTALGNNNDESPIKTDWFVKIVSLQRGNRLILKPLVNLSIVIIMLLWMIAGLCTLGLVWPRHIRRKIFTPTTTDHIMKTDDDAEIDDLLQMKEENSLLAKENAMLIEQITHLQNEARKGSPILT